MKGKIELKHFKSFPNLFKKFTLKTANIFDDSKE